METGPHRQPRRTSVCRDRENGGERERKKGKEPQRNKEMEQKNREPDRQIDKGADSETAPWREREAQGQELTEREAG